MKFTDQLWQSSLPVYGEILRHPFIAELTAGTLSRERFAFYLKQDALYLRDFSRCLAITAAHLSEVSQAQSLLEFAHGALVVERQLHEKYLEQFGLTLDAEKAPACFAYTQYLLATASNAPCSESVAALLPCFWVYRNVGQEIAQQAAASLQSNPYARWIETYAASEFDGRVTRAIEIVEAQGQAATPTELAAMDRAFQRSVRLEWMFWDSAYRLERWPPTS